MMVLMIVKRVVCDSGENHGGVDSNVEGRGSVCVWRGCK